MFIYDDKFHLISVIASLNFFDWESDDHWEPYIVPDIIVPVIICLILCSCQISVYNWEYAEISCIHRKTPRILCFDVLKKLC